MTYAARLRAGATMVGAWSQTGSQAAVELLAAGGADHVVVDLQHGYATDADLPRLFAGIEAHGAAPLVRLASHDRAGIGRALDLGARGIIVPEVSTAAQARAVVAASRIPPDGTRSFGPIRTAIARSDREEVAVIAQIESREAVEAVDEIASVAGIDVLLVGPWDLSLSLGLPVPPDLGGERLADALARVRASADGHGLAAGVHTLVGEKAAPLVQAGWRFVNAADDVTLLRGAREHVERARAAR